MLANCEVWFWLEAPDGLCVYVFSVWFPNYDFFLQNPISEWGVSFPWSTDSVTNVTVGLLFRFSLNEV
jgi:hypothetical protein